MACVFDQAIQDYHRALVEEIARRFDLTCTMRKATPAHFALKYWFSAPTDGETERVIEAFAATHTASPVHVGGVGHFERDVLFVPVTLSDEAHRTLDELLAALRMRPWMTWDRRDGAHLRPHMTLAERCGARFDEAWTFAAAHVRRFDCSLDNVTVFRDDGAGQGAPRYTVVRRFPLSSG